MGNYRRNMQTLDQYHNNMPTIKKTETLVDKIKDILKMYESLTKYMYIHIYI